MKICGKTAALIGLAALGGGVCAAEPMLTVTTSSPERNFFAHGSTARATVSAKGLNANDSREVRLSVYDFTRTNLVTTLTGRIAANASGDGSASFELPTARYGVYYVATSSGDLKPAKVGTAPAGFFTYAVLEDPARMPDLDPWDGFLGEHCANFDWLWQRGGLGSALQPSSNRLIVATTHRDAAEYKIGKDFWTIATNAAMQAKLRDNLTDYVRKAIAAGPGRQGRRIYENMWEPNLRAPNPESIVLVQKICWETIHKLDPDALVCAYTSSGIDLRFLRTLMDKGLGQYMNALSVHPYKGMPEAGGFVEDIRAMKRILREYCGRDLPLFSTESGMNEPNTVEGERNKLCGQLRQALILKGEGFQLYCPFYGCDYGADLNNQGDGDYGLNYNSQYPKVRYGPKISQPRPIFAALAAFGRLTEAHFPTCAIEYLAETVLGYAFTDRKDTDSVLALWDWGGRNTTVEVPVGRAEVDVADVMGNVTRHKTDKGVMRLTLSEQPCYLLHVDPAIWGRAAQAKLKWSERRFASANDLAPVGISDFTPAFEKSAPGVAVTLANRTDAAVAVSLEVLIPDEPNCHKKASVSVPANAEKRVTLAFDGFCPDPTAVFKTVARVVPEKGTVVEMEESFNFLSVPGSFSFGNCQVRMTADSRSLTFDVTAKDATPRNDCTGWWNWNGDALQIALAKEYLRKRTQNDVADACNQAYCEYTVAMTSLGPEVCRTITWDPNRYPCDTARLGIVDPSVVPRTVTHDGTNWHYVVSLPWEFLNLHEPKGGTAFRLAFQCNDRVPDDPALHSVQCFKMKKAAPRHFGWAVLDNAGEEKVSGLSVQLDLNAKHQRPLSAWLADVRASRADSVQLVACEFFLEGERRRAYLEKLKKEIAFFEAAGYPVIVWTSTLGYGDEGDDDRIAFTTKRGLTRLTGFDGRKTCGALCAADPKTVACLQENIRDFARIGAKTVLLDDEIVQARRENMSCLCPRHLSLISAKAGRPVTGEDVKASLAGAPNAVRTAYFDAMGETLEAFVRALRAAADEVNPDMRMGVCGSFNSYDAEGTDEGRLVRILAGRGRPLLRLSGASYWVKCLWGTHYDGQDMGGVAEFFRLQLSWFDRDKVSVMDENDPYPRDTKVIDTRMVELYDTLSIVSGVPVRDKYILRASPTYDPAYLKSHVAHEAEHQRLKALFADSRAVGWRVFKPQHYVREAHLAPVFPGPRQFLFEASHPRAGIFLTLAGQTTAYEAGEGAVAVFGDEAAALPAVRRRAVLTDATGLAALRRSGSKIGELRRTCGVFRLYEDDAGAKTAVVDWKEDYSRRTHHPLFASSAFRANLSDVHAFLTGKEPAVAVLGAPEVYAYAARDRSGAIKVLLANVSDSPTKPFTVRINGQEKTIPPLPAWGWRCERGMRDEG